MLPSIACAVMLLLMLIGFGPLSRLTSDYGKVYLTSSAKTSPTTAPTAMNTLLKTEP